MILLAFNLPSSGLMVLINMNTYILTEGKNFKTFLKENYPIALCSCMLKKVEHLIEPDVDSAYGVYIY